MPLNSYFITLADALNKQAWGTAGPRRPQPAETRQLTLTAVRGEVTGFQVQVSAGHDFTLALDDANWLHPLGFLPRARLAVDFPSLPAESVEVFAVGWVEGDDRRLWMETLDRSGYAEALGGRPQAVYVRLRIPAEIEAGQHTGRVYVYAQQGFEDEQPLWEGSVQVSISPVRLPGPQDFAFYLNLWQHCTAVARQHHVALWSDAHFAILDRYYASLAQLGQKAISVIAAEIPWSGQRCYRDAGYPSYLFEHSVIRVERAEDGSLSLDFAHLDRLLALAAKHHIDRQIDLFGLLNVWQDEAYGFGKVAPDAPDAIRVRCFDRASRRYTYLRTAAELRAYLRALQDHLRWLGVLERVRIAADEPGDLPAFRASLAFVREAAPDFRYNAAINHYEFIEEAPPQVSDFIPVLPLAAREPQRTADLTAQVHERGGLMLWYVCCWPPIPNTFLHSPLVEGRLIGWLTHYLGLDGFLRWAFCLWPADPWQRVSFRAPGWSAGDMYFVLPGPDGAPVETLRYEALRMAAQDYELLYQVTQRLTPEAGRAVLEAAFGRILHAESTAAFAEVGTAQPEGLYSLDPQDYHQARDLLVKALEDSIHDPA